MSRTDWYSPMSTASVPWSACSVSACSADPHGRGRAGLCGLQRLPGDLVERAAVELLVLGAGDGLRGQDEIAPPGHPVDDHAAAPDVQPGGVLQRVPERGGAGEAFQFDDRRSPRAARGRAGRTAPARCRRAGARRAPASGGRTGRGRRRAGPPRRSCACRSGSSAPARRCPAEPSSPPPRRRGPSPRSSPLSSGRSTGRVPTGRRGRGPTARRPGRRRYAPSVSLLQFATCQSPPPGRYGSGQVVPAGCQVSQHGAGGVTGPTAGGWYVLGPSGNSRPTGSRCWRGSCARRRHGPLQVSSSRAHQLGSSTRSRTRGTSCAAARRGAPSSGSHGVGL
jgi:hypothetical protein